MMEQKPGDGTPLGQTETVAGGSVVVGLGAVVGTMLLFSVGAALALVVSLTLEVVTSAGLAVVEVASSEEVFFSSTGHVHSGMVAGSWPRGM